MKRSITAVAFVFCFWASFAVSAQNTSMSSDEILDVCTRADMSWIDFCNGFFQAVLDNITVSEEICVPTGTTRTNLAELYQIEATRIIQADPTIGERVAVSLASQILRETYSCR